MRKIIKKIATPILSRMYHWYYSKPRNFTYDNITVLVKSGVFSPRFTISTKILLEFLNDFDLKDKNLLELGAGSGIISFFAERNGAIVTSSDISKNVINGLEYNKEKLDSDITIIHSDLFDKIPQQAYDYIIINPPYYKKNASNEKEMAWYCGEDFQYFKKLFEQIRAFINEDSYCYMILSEDCQIDEIRYLALSHELNMITTLQKKVAGELNYIFKIEVK